MNDLFFWKSWTLRERVTFWGLALLIILALAGLFLNSLAFNGAGSANWDILTRVSDTSIPANQLDLGSFRFIIQVPSVLVTEEYAAPLMLPDTRQTVLFLILAILGLSVAFAALTTLPRFWFLAGLSVFILLTVFSRTEFLTLKGLPERSLLFLILILYGGTGYYFQAFRTQTPVSSRILTFLLISLALGLLTGSLTSTPYPAYAFAACSMPFWLVLSVIFLLMSATDIWYGLIWLTTSSVTGMGKRALPNFLVIAFIYLLILVFAYVSNTRMADWGMVIVPAYLLAAVAAIIGIWSFKPRCDNSEIHLSYRETGLWLYLGMFLVTAAMTGMAAAAHNDPLLEVLEDTVINGQLGMGAVFLFYIAVNFLPLLRDGYRVHRVLYKPLKFNLWKARIIGVGAVVILFSMQNMLPLKQAIAGYFNGLGDWHTLTEKYRPAEQYYQHSLQQEFQNHKANYSLATLARVQGDKNAAVYYFRQATLKKPSPQAYAGLSNLLMEENLYFESMFNLKEGLRKFPENSALLNNLGILYARTNVADSAYYYLNAAERNSSDGIPTLNIIGTLVNVLDTPTLDSLLREGPASSSVSWHANRLVVQNLAGRFEPETMQRDAIRNDSLLSAGGYAYWINFLYNQGRNDETLGEKGRNIVLHNDMLADDLLLAAAHADFYGGDKTRALETLLSLLNGETQRSQLYEKILGHWFLQLGLYEQAIGYFSQVPDEEGIIGHAVAQALSGNPVAGSVVIESLKQLNVDPGQIEMLQQQIVKLAPPSGKAQDRLTELKLKGNEKAYLAALRQNPYDPDIVKAVAEFYAVRQSDVQEAYQIVVNALRFNETSPVIWGEYALLNLELGLSDLAEEAREKVRSLTDDTAYHEFHTRYQAKWTLKQKQREEFR